MQSGTKSRQILFKKDPWASLGRLVPRPAVTAEGGPPAPKTSHAIHNGPTLLSNCAATCNAPLVSKCQVKRRFLCSRALPEKLVGNVSFNSGFAAGFNTINPPTWGASQLSIDLQFRLTNSLQDVTSIGNQGGKVQIQLLVPGFLMYFTRILISSPLLKCLPPSSCSLC